MIHTSTVISNVATSTITVDCCNSDHDGQLTFSNNSLYDSRKYVVILFMLKLIARVLGFEPRLKVLETSVLPLYYTRVSKNISSSPPSAIRTSARKLRAIPITLGTALSTTNI